MGDGALARTFFSRAFSAFSSFWAFFAWRLSDFAVNCGTSVRQPTFNGREVRRVWVP